MIYFIAAIGIIARILPRLLRPNAMVSDTYFHLVYARAVRENHFRPPTRYPGVVLNHRVEYPFLYHFLLAAFPVRIRSWIERFSAALFDAAGLILIFLFSTWAIKVDNLNQASLPLFCAAIFVLHPSLLRIGLGPRIYSGSERILGQTLYLAHIFAAYVSYVSHSPVMALISLSAGSLLIITAKFGIQVLVFFGVFFCFFLSYWYLFLLLACFALSILMTKGWVLNVFRGQVYHLTFYYRHLQKVFLYPSLTTFPRYISIAFSHLRHFNLPQIVGWCLHGETYFLHMFLTVNTQFVLFLFIWPQFLSSSLDRFLVVWTAAAVVWFFLTKHKRLLFLGEGERYLEYGLFPAIFLTTKYLLGHGAENIIYLWLAYSLLAACFYIYTYLRHTVDDFNETQPIFSALNELEEGVIWPIGSYQWQVLYRSHFPVLTWGGFDPKLISVEEFMTVHGNYPYPSDRFAEIIDRYRVAYIVTDHGSLNHYVTNILKQPTSFLSLLEPYREAGKMILFRIKRPARQTACNNLPCNSPRGGVISD